MKFTPALLLVFVSLGCTNSVEYIHDRHACPTDGGDLEESDTDSEQGTGGSGLGEGTGSEGGNTGSEGGSSGSEGGSSEGGSTGSEEGSTGSGGEEPPSGGLPTPTAPCPTFANGVVTFCPSGLDTCRDALVVNADGATGNGPLSLHWHGTYESPDGILSWDFAAQTLASMVESEGGLMVLPYADPASVNRPGVPFPWWVVCGDYGTECDRLDDFIFADEIVACAVDQGVVDPQRLTTSGMSAGGIMTSHMVNRRGYFAGAVSWSGGLPVAHQPATPPANDTAVITFHGGPTDAYCGNGVESCYDFVGPTEAFAADLDAAGHYVFLCDHQSGHSAGMGPQGAEFLRLAHADGHPWEASPLGSTGNWMIDNYCYYSGEPSPWQ